MTILSPTAWAFSWWGCTYPVTQMCIRDSFLTQRGTSVAVVVWMAVARELIEQRTEDVLGPYDLHDFFLFHFIKYGAEPVSYTHLDVYKRQAVSRTAPTAAPQRSVS